jgi:hypothetical protein
MQREHFVQIGHSGLLFNGFNPNLRITLINHEHRFIGRAARRGTKKPDPPACSDLAQQQLDAGAGRLQIDPGTRTLRRGDARSRRSLATGKRRRQCNCHRHIDQTEIHEDAPSTIENERWHVPPVPVAYTRAAYEKAATSFTEWKDGLVVNRSCPVARLE